MDVLKLKLIETHSEDLNEISVFQAAFSFACTLERANNLPKALKYYNKALSLTVESEHAQLCSKHIASIKNNNRNYLV